MHKFVTLLIFLFFISTHAMFFNYRFVDDDDSFIDFEEDHKRKRTNLHLSASLSDLESIEVNWSIAELKDLAQRKFSELLAKIKAERQKLKKIIKDSENLPHNLKNNPYYMLMLEVSDYQVEKEKLKSLKRTIRSFKALKARLNIVNDSTSLREINETLGDALEAV